MNSSSGMLSGSSTNLNISNHSRRVQPNHITVFHATPLVELPRWTPTNRLVDIQKERAAIAEALEATSVNVLYKIATPKSLGDFISRGNRFLHLTCHGNATTSHLEIENQYGASYELRTDEDLKAWVKKGDNKLSMVMLFACHSRRAGETFVEAGAEHVICSRASTQRMSHKASTKFAYRFYYTLAHAERTSIQQAFDLAVQEVRNDPELSQHADTYILLPEDGDHSENPLAENWQDFGDLSVRMDSSSRMEAFDDSYSVASSRQMQNHRLDPITRLPEQPDNFFGRGYELCTILHRLLEEDYKIVRIHGRPGIGKDTLARVAGHFIAQRNYWGDTIWLPPVNLPCEEGDLMYCLEEIFKLITSDTSSSVLLEDPNFVSVQKLFMEHLFNRKVIFILNTTRFGSRNLPQVIERVGAWIENTLSGTSRVKFIIVEAESLQVRPFSRRFFEQKDNKVILPPLDDMNSQSLFFSWATLQRCADPRSILLEILKSCEGIPQRIQYLAKQLQSDNAPITKALVHQIVSACVSETENVADIDIESSAIRSQEEVRARFNSLLRERNLVFRKCKAVYIRDAVKGEEITTAIDGEVEGIDIVKDSTSKIACGKIKRELYILSKTQFERLYHIDSGRSIEERVPDLHDEGFQEYQTKDKLVWAHTVTDEDISWFDTGGESRVVEGAIGRVVEFMAPWGERTRVNNGDKLVMEKYPIDVGEIYRVKHSAFRYTYEAVEDDDSTYSAETEIVRTQDEVQQHFGELLRLRDLVFRKCKSTYIRPARLGEEITTIIDGEVEGCNTVLDDESMVACGKVKKELWVLTRDQFERLYVETSGISIEDCEPDLHDEGFMEYSSRKKLVWAHTVTDQDMEWFRNGGTGRLVPGVMGRVVEFMSPWGEKTRVNFGDRLVMENYPEESDDIYRVKHSAFRYSYDSLRWDRFNA